MLCRLQFGSPSETVRQSMASSTCFHQDWRTSSLDRRTDEYLDAVEHQAVSPPPVCLRNGGTPPGARPRIVTGEAERREAARAEKMANAVFQLLRQGARRLRAESDDLIP